MLAVMIDSDLGGGRGDSDGLLGEKDLPQVFWAGCCSGFSFFKGSVCGVYCPHACFPGGCDVAVEPVADHDGVCGGNTEQFEGFLVYCGVGFFDAEGFGGDDRFKVGGESEEFEPQVCFAGVGVGDDGKADAAAVQFC